MGRDEASIRIIFFDGVCVMCNRFADFIIRHDKNRVFKIATLQGVKAQKFLSTHDVKDMSSLILFTDKEKYYATDAFVEICTHLSFPFSLGQYIKFLPKPWRDLLYYKLAKKRYQLFGKLKHCRIPSPDEKDRFLD